jgi:glycogen(starch) synthase
MHICLVHEEYPIAPDCGGIATYHKNIALGFHELGHQVTVICRAHQEARTYVEDGISVHRIRPQTGADEFETARRYRMHVMEMLLDFEKKEGIDIVESPEWGAETVFYHQYRSVPLVIRLHTPLVIWAIHNQCSAYTSIHQVMLAWEKQVIESADLVTSCTEAVKREVQSEMALARNDIHVIPNPADLKNFYPAGPHQDSRIILYCGSLQMRKGVHVLARAIPIVLDKASDAEFVFAGRDTKINDQQISMKEYIYSLIPPEYHKSLRFYGDIDHDKLNAIYNQARIAVFPSLYENFPNVVLEAMAVGLPIVGSTSGGMPEMLDEGYSGQLYTPPDHQELAEKILRFWEDREFAARCAQNARVKVNHDFEPVKLAEKTIGLYQLAFEQFNQTRGILTSLK